jgi:hypothetical protein
MVATPAQPGGSPLLIGQRYRWMIASFALQAGTNRTLRRSDVLTALLGNPRTEVGTQPAWSVLRGSSNSSRQLNNATIAPQACSGHWALGMPTAVLHASPAHLASIRTVRAVSSASAVGPASLHSKTRLKPSFPFWKVTFVRRALSVNTCPWIQGCTARTALQANTGLRLPVRLMRMPLARTV